MGNNYNFLDLKKMAIKYIIIIQDKRAEIRWKVLCYEKKTICTVA